MLFRRLVSSTHAACIVPVVSHAAFSVTSPNLFDAREYQIQKRLRKERERLGIDETNDESDEMPWVDPDEQARIDAEEATRRQEEAALVAAMLAERTAQDKLKRDKFKQWRAGQIAKSKERKSSADDAKSDSPRKGRAINEVVTEAHETNMAERGDFSELSPEVELQDVSEKRRTIHALNSELKKEGRDE